MQYLNNLIEQDHRTVKKRVWLAKGYVSFQSAWRTLQGIEAVNMIRKGRVSGWPKTMHLAKHSSPPSCSESPSNEPLWPTERGRNAACSNFAMEPFGSAQSRLSRLYERCHQGECNYR